jgi:hypothetical protein
VYPPFPHPPPRPRPKSCSQASLIEKAYAKAHGSYKAISGGEIAEALLDLTGAPTQTIDFAARSFDSEALWGRLVASVTSSRETASRVSPPFFRLVMGWGACILPPAACGSRVTVDEKKIVADFDLLSS